MLLHGQPPSPAVADEMQPLNDARFMVAVSRCGPFRVVEESL